jgi:hypothetical protein
MKGVVVGYRLSVVGSIEGAESLVVGGSLLAGRTFLS